MVRYRQGLPVAHTIRSCDDADNYLCESRIGVICGRAFVHFLRVLRVEVLVAGNGDIDFQCQGCQSSGYCDDQLVSFKAEVGHVVPERHPHAHFDDVFFQL